MVVRVYYSTLMGFVSNQLWLPQLHFFKLTNNWVFVFSPLFHFSVFQLNVHLISANLCQYSFQIPLNYRFLMSDLILDNILTSFSIVHYFFKLLTCWCSLHKGTLIAALPRFSWLILNKSCLWNLISCFVNEVWKYAPFYCFSGKLEKTSGKNICITIDESNAASIIILTLHIIYCIYIYMLSIM